MEYIYSSGRREIRKETDVASTAMNVMWKIALMVIGVIVFVGVSVPIMAIEAFGGLPEKIRELKASKVFINIDLDNLPEVVIFATFGKLSIIDILLVSHIL